jgi:hypothetical protein
MKKILVFGFVLLFGAAVLLLRAITRPVVHADLGGAPLTDLAPRPTRTPLFVEQAPQRSPPPQLVKARWVAPQKMPDPAHPPTWTRVLAAPPAPEPPDPFIDPPMAVDPNRGREVARVE